ncbi:phosphopantetheine-binding protein [Plantactinospora sp. KLBMP9567]|uniref:phosphopantetheine-binding protein n=1 Tax=Plantactinospora sp. KLBMP9567 TaxID=3085900 RepID=UPI002981D897|nr:phosphopantetheine-binding protein [Plantactinospora sp. KLBMP9567]MDW5330134.1 phosphopantetheine-binding protein [Plantactinospora sp. KLBMP9567]
MTVTVSRDDLEMASEYVPPRTELERRLIRMWSAKLGVAPIGVHDDFFELGGDSLLAADLQLDIDTELGVEATTGTLFLLPTVAALAEALGPLRGSDGHG